MAETESILTVKIVGTKELTDLKGEIEKTRKSQKELRQELKKGTKTQEEFNRETAQADAKLSVLNKRYTQAKRKVQQYNGAVKKTGSFTKKLSGALTTALTSFVSITAAIALAQQGLSQFISVTGDFEQQMARVKAITGANADEFDKLSRSAQRLGKSTIFTATQVGELQEEFSKLGFSTEEILNATEATLLLATATQEDLGSAASTVGATLKQFGLDAVETQRVTDVMSKSFSSSGLKMENFTEAMKLVGPTARATNRSVEETTALLGILADNQLKGSIGGTNLNRIFLELNKQGLSLNEAYKIVNESSNKLAAATDLVKDRGAKGLLILAEQQEAYGKLKEIIDSAEGSTKIMAETVSDTFQGDVKKLTSAWEGFLLALEGSDALRSVVQFATELVTSIGNLTEKFSAIDTQGNVITRFFGRLGEAAKVFAGHLIPFRDAVKGIKELLGFLDESIEINEGLIPLEREKIKAYEEEAVAIDPLIEAVESLNLTEEQLEAERIKRDKEAKKRAEKRRKDREKDIANEADFAKRFKEVTDLMETAPDKITPVTEAHAEFNAQISQANKDLESLNTKQQVEAEAAEEIAQDKVANNQVVAASFADLFGSLSTLFEQGSAEQKAFATTEAIINTFLGVTQVLRDATLPTLAKIALVPAIIASGVGAIRQINKAEHGMLLSGPSHKQGGIPIEAEGGEAIINKKSTAMFLPQLSAMNQAGGGISFTNGKSGGKFANGGLVGPSIPGGGSLTATDLDRAFDRVKIVNNVQETVSVAGKVTEVRNLATA